MDRRPALIRKSDLTPAFEAAKAAGFEQVSVLYETPDGMRFLINAGSTGDVGKANMTSLERWRSERGTA